MTYYKYPRTPHMPYSHSKTDDDKTLESDSHFYDMDAVIVTEKMDGENTSVYNNGKCHARSIDSRHETYHSILLNQIQTWCHILPEGFRVCGEYLYVKHAIHYMDLQSYFYGFSVWNGPKCLDWNNTIKILNELEVTPVPILYMGLYDREKIEDIFMKAEQDGKEGIVIRNAAGFHIHDFGKNVAKCVRKNHVQTNVHWTKVPPIENNRLIGKE